MKFSQSQILSSEINELESLLSEIPIANVIDRLGLENRLASAEQKLKDLQPEKNITTELTFKGKMVNGTHGINAEFGSKAAGSFAEAIVTIAASIDTDNLSAKGPIPEKQKHQLLITGTAVGSFGFTFEIPQTASDDEDNIENTLTAIDKFQDILNLAVSGSDDDITAVLDEVHHRAIKKVSDFLSHLNQNETYCSVKHGEKLFSFDNLTQLKTSSDRLNDENIIENEEVHQGSFVGFLPFKKVFEFQRKDNKKIITGKFLFDISAPEQLFKDYLNKQVNVSFNTIKLGEGKPRFNITAFNNIELIQN